MADAQTAAARWLIEHRHLLPPSGTALDVACGRGRNAIWLATQGLTVLAVDRDADAVNALNADAGRLGIPVTATVLDLEAGTPVLGSEAFDVIVGVSYLFRPLFPALIDALRPGGLLVYETFTRDQALRGKPTNPAFLLSPGELQHLVSPLEILVAREGEVDGRCLASVIARKNALDYEPARPSARAAT